MCRCRGFGGGGGSGRWVPCRGCPWATGSVVRRALRGRWGRASVDGSGAGGCAGVCVGSGAAAPRPPGPSDPAGAGLDAPGSRTPVPRAVRTVHTTPARSDAAGARPRPRGGGARRGAGPRPRLDLAHGVAARRVTGVAVRGAGAGRPGRGRRVRGRSAGSCVTGSRRRRGVPWNIPLAALGRAHGRRWRVG